MNKLFDLFLRTQGFRNFGIVSQNEHNNMIATITSKAPGPMVKAFLEIMDEKVTVIST